MHITGQLPLTWAIVRRIFTRSTNNRMFRIVGVVGLLLGLLLLLAGPGLITFIIIGSGVLLILLPELLIAQLWRQARTKTDGLAHYVLTDRSITVGAIGVVAQATWLEITSGRVRERDWRLGAPYAILGLVPRAAFSTADRAQFDAFIAAGQFPRHVPPAAAPGTTGKPSATGTPGTVRDGRRQPGREAASG